MSAPLVLPIMLLPAGRAALVVGAGEVAARRIAWLIEAGAEVEAVAPEVSEQVSAFETKGLVTVHREPYCTQHMSGKWLAVAATNNPDVNAQVVSDARAHGVLVGDASDPGRGDFITPGSVRRGRLVLAATTSRASPRLASRITQELSARYGPEYGVYLDMISEVRDQILGSEPQNPARKARLRQLADDDEILSLVREGRMLEAREKANSWIS